MAALDTGAADSMSDAYKGMSSDNIKGLVLGLSSSLFIGASFIVKKKGLKKAGASGVRAGVGGYSYLLEPLWWVGMITSGFQSMDYWPARVVQSDSSVSSSSDGTG